ncbi:MAG TPA: SIS domain-containing protein [Thermoplasmatales archaeon]|nr:SIS domain-containing protein [Candidatus Thermoplasmatota archaeon]MDD5777863.1 SIS domain-containing protein [Candidatus Thermoplasmatota archaeon]HDS58796.1 SIS domain-containing protein [Thermoplasmatales archaeon]
MKDCSRFDPAISYIGERLTAILDNVDRVRIAEAVNLFMKAPRIFIYGTGRSGLVGKAFAIRLVHLGFQTFVIGETITAPVQKNDLVVLISGSGETIPVAMTAEIARRLGAKIVSITANPESHTARFADVVIILDTGEGDADLAPLGTLFESSAWVLLDGLVAELMARTGEDEENMKERHATLE